MATSISSPPSPPASSSSRSVAPRSTAGAATVGQTPALERILSTYLLRVDTAAAARPSVKGKERQHSAGLALIMNDEDTPPSPVSPVVQPTSAIVSPAIDEDRDMLRLILETKRSEDQRLAAADALRVEEMRRSNLKAEIWLQRQRQEREARSVSVAPKREHSGSMSRSPSPSGAYITPRPSFVYRTPSVDNVVIKAEPDDGRLSFDHYRQRLSYPPMSNEPSGPIGAAFALRYAGTSAGQQHSGHPQHHARPRGTPLPPPPPAGYGYAPYPHHHHGHAGYSYAPTYPAHAVAATSSRSTTASTSSVHARSVSPRMPAVQQPMTPESEGDRFSPVAARKRSADEIESGDEDSEDEKDAEESSKGPLTHEEVMKQLRRKLRRNAKQRLQTNSASPAAATPVPESQAKPTPPRSRSSTTASARATTSAVAAAAAARAKAMRMGTCVKPSSAASSSESWRPESLKTARTSDVRGE